jgi:hypothetical protein
MRDIFLSSANALLYTIIDEPVEAKTSSVPVATQSAVL